MNTVSQKAQDVFVSTATLLERKGREEGRMEGREEGVEQVALSMLKAGMEDNTISKLTALSKEHLKRLKIQIAKTRS